jgi:hypothetical protein
MKGGVPAEVVNGQTKVDYVASLTIANYEYFLCNKARISLNFKNLNQDAQQSYFSGCELINAPSKPFN